MDAMIDAYVYEGKFEPTQINSSLTGTAPLGGDRGLKTSYHYPVKVPILFDLITNLFTYISIIYFALIQ